LKKRKTRSQRSRPFRCPHCGAAMILRPASEIYHDAKTNRKLYVCHNYPVCNTYVAAHPNTDMPMGIPADGNLRNLRIQAHRKFDRNIAEVGWLGSSSAITRRFFLAFQYEPQMKAKRNTVRAIAERLNEEADTARR